MPDKYVNWNAIYIKWKELPKESESLEEIDVTSDEADEEMHENRAELTDEQFNACLTEIQEAFSIQARDEKTVVFLLVIDLEGENYDLKVPCMSGYSLSGYARLRDNSEDCYLVNCVEVVHLGHVPIVFELSIKKTGGWKTIIPMPDKIIEKYLNSYFKRQVKAVKKKYPRPRYEFHYIQMLDCR